jgi:hypothetical protein
MVTLNIFMTKTLSVRQSHTTSAPVGKQRQHLNTQMVIFEDKIQMLRTSMADIGDEIARNTHEISRFGLMSGIDCIRTLLNEIRDVGYH